LNKLETLAHRVRPRMPFTALNTVWRILDKNAESILDVGCGKGEPMQFINRHRRFYTVGVDIFEPYIAECRRQGIHDEYLQCDVRHLPFEDNSFDIVICLEVLEHVEAEEGQALLKNLERIARKQVILSTPVGHYEQTSFDGNKHQEHKYLWQPADLEAAGYRVIGIGLRNLGGKSGVQSPLPALLRSLIDVTWVLSGPLTFYFPEVAGDMVCVKNIFE
jgi:SAM-dependent methyltransferase